MSTPELPAPADRAADPATTEIDSRVDEVLRGQIRARISRLVADPDEVEDLTQETLLRVVRGLPRFRGEASLRTWALRIAGNVVIDQRRRSACRPAPPPVVAPEADPAEGELELAPAPPDQLERTISADCLRGALATLSASYRQVFELHDLSGLTGAEIAELLDLPLATVKIRIHRARRRLRERCEAGCEVYRGDRGEVACCPRDDPR